MKKYLAPLMVGLLLVTSCSTDPVSVVGQFQDAVNSKDIESTLELFADDAELQVDGTQSRVGKTEIEDWLATQVELNFRIEGEPTTSESGVAFESCSISSAQYIYVGVNPMSGICEVTLDGGHITSFVVQFDEDSMARLSESEAAVSADLVGIWTSRGAIPGGNNQVSEDIVTFYLHFVEDGSARLAIPPEDLLIAPDADHPGARLTWTYEDHVLTLQNQGPASEGYCQEQDVGTYLVKHRSGGGIKFKPLEDPCFFRVNILQRFGAEWDSYVP